MKIAWILLLIWVATFVVTLPIYWLLFGMVDK